jgi:cobalt-zinc-cadmium efflux system membrane fusion protein
MNRQFKIWLLFLSIFSLALNGCREASQEEEVSDTPAAVETVSLSAEQYKRAGITTGKPGMEKLAQKINARGIITVSNSGIAIASTLIEGIVTDIFVQYGESVNRGEALCRLRHPSIIEAQQKYLESTYALQLAKDNYERAKELRKENITSEKAFLKAESEFLLATSSNQASLAELNMIGIDPANVEAGKIVEYIDIKSPISGKVNEIMAKIGEYVEINEVLVEIVDLEELILKLKVFESDIPDIRIGQSLVFTLSNVNDIPYKATIEATSSIIEQGTRALEVRAGLAEKVTEAYPGMFVAASINAGEKNALAIPAAAIAEEGEDEKYVFVLDSSEEGVYHFVKKPVMIGTSSDNLVEILPGQDIDQNTEVVITGVYYLKSEMLKELE